MSIEWVKRQAEKAGAVVAVVVPNWHAARVTLDNLREAMPEAVSSASAASLTMPNGSTVMVLQDGLRDRIRGLQFDAVLACAPRQWRCAATVENLHMALRGGAFRITEDAFLSDRDASPAFLTGLASALRR